MAKLTNDEKSTIKNKIAEMKEIVRGTDINAKTAKQYPVTDGEINSLVKLFYQLQGQRIAVGNEAYAEVNTAFTNGTEATPFILLHIQNDLEQLEEDISKFLENYAKNNPVGLWMMSHHGIGPIFAAGLLAYIDIDRCQTAGSIWNYAGITGDPEHDRRQRGKKLSYDPGFKVLCWKIGESFQKVSYNENAVYGQLYKEKLAYYKKKNEEGGFAERAKQILSEKIFKDKTTNAYKAYSNGKLPDGHMIAMAKRFAVKIFLSHLFDVWFEYRHGLKPPQPFVKEHLGHVHIITPPNKELLIPNSSNNPGTPYIIKTENGERIIRTNIPDFDEIIIRCNRYIEHVEAESTIESIKNKDTGEIIFSNSNPNKTIVEEKSETNKPSSDKAPETPKEKKVRIPYEVTFSDGTTGTFKSSNANPINYAKTKYKNTGLDIVRIVNMTTNKVITK